MGYGISKLYVLIVYFVQIIYFINNKQKTASNLLQKLLICKRDIQENILSSPLNSTQINF